MARRIIYDFGANDGDDVAYYLKKADLVVAVEANPQLCTAMELKFASEIEGGRLVIENSVLVTDANAGKAVSFYIHRGDQALSQFPEPSVSDIGAFEEVRLPSVRPSAIVERHGQPYFIKIDLERYDAQVMRELFAAGVRPPFISAESHDIEVFAVMVAMGNYNSFNLVRGQTVHRKFADHPIITDEGRATHSFRWGAAGPFGNDIPGPWMTANNFADRITFEGLGWIDIHATTDIAPDPAYTMRNGIRRKMVAKVVKEMVWPYVPDRLRQALTR